jgi:hypothetical protein
MNNKETKHTPGPWEVMKNEPTVIRGHNRDKPYSFSLAETMGYKENREANARLIAAAPDMLDILEQVSDMVIAGSYPDGPCMERYLMEDVRAVIAKAKGESND